MAKIAADLTHLNGQFERDVVIEYDESSGRITRVVRNADAVDARLLRHRALLPGFVNTHSHAFQRLIRGRTQWRLASVASSDFWSWREAMYAAVLRLTPDEVFRVSRFCFLEMLNAGFTSVGEFHYLQRDESGGAYGNELELHDAVLAAAAEVGIRIVLINTAYATGGVTQPLRSTQRRFNTPSLDGYLAVCEQLRTRVSDMEHATMAVAAHSLRAVPVDWLKAVHDWAAAADVPMHMHVSEQIAEVDACSSIYRKRPIELLNDLGVLDARFTAVHATHLAVQEIALLARARSTVCACPSTERDLGDGVLPAASLHMAGVHIAIGTDIQSVIDPFEEIRLIEYHERLRRYERVLLGTKAGDRTSVAPTLIGYGTSEGARALQLEAGELADGRLADMVAVDLQHLQLAGWSLDSLDAMLALSASAAVVSDVWVGGRHVIRDRSHPMAEKIVREFERVASV